MGMIGIAYQFIREEYEINSLASCISGLKGYAFRRIILEIESESIGSLLKITAFLYASTYGPSSTELFILLPQLTHQSYQLRKSDIKLQLNLSSRFKKSIPFSYSNFQFGQITLETYPSVYIDGTFDHLHPGHLLLFTVAGVISKHLTVGITSQSCILHKIQSEKIQEWKLRMQNVNEFLRIFNPITSLEFIEICESLAGPSSQNFDAVVISSEDGYPFAEISELRTLKHYKPLKRIVVELLQINFRKISSTNLRMLL